MADYQVLLEDRPRPSRNEKDNFVKQVNHKPVQELKRKASIEALLSSLEWLQE